jgi:hypothetical protein
VHGVPRRLCLAPPMRHEPPPFGRLPARTLAKAATPLSARAKSQLELCPPIVPLSARFFHAHFRSEDRTMDEWTLARSF